MLALVIVSEKHCSGEDQEARFSIWASQMSGSEANSSVLGEAVCKVVRLCRLTEDSTFCA